MKQAIEELVDSVTIESESDGKNCFQGTSTVSRPYHGDSFRVDWTIFSNQDTLPLAAFEDKFVIAQPSPYSSEDLDRKGIILQRFLSSQLSFADTMFYQFDRTDYSSAEETAFANSVVCFFVTKSRNAFSYGLITTDLKLKHPGPDYIANSIRSNLTRVLNMYPYTKPNVIARQRVYWEFDRLFDIFKGEGVVFERSGDAPRDSNQDHTWYYNAGAFTSPQQMKKFALEQVFMNSFLLTETPTLLQFDARKTELFSQLTCYSHRSNSMNIRCSLSLRPPPRAETN